MTDTIESLRAERDALMAHIGRWNEAWMVCAETGFEYSLEAVADETPAQSLNHIKASALDEAMAKATAVIDSDDTAEAFCDQLMAIADEWRGE